MQSILAFIRKNIWIVLFTLFAPVILNLWLYYDYKHKLDHQNKINDYLITEIEEVRSWLVAIQHLDSLRAMLLAKLDITQTLTNENDYRFELYSLLANVPEGVTLQALDVDESETGIYGIAASTDSIQHFVSNLNELAICGDSLDIKPENSPGSFVISCQHVRGDVDHAL